MPATGSTTSSESLQLEENVAPDLGDESLGYATVIDLGAAGEATGYVVYVLTGQYVVLIDVNAVSGVELATVEDILEEQLACLDAGVCDRIGSRFRMRLADGASADDDEDFRLIDIPARR